MLIMTNILYTKKLLNEEYLLRPDIAQLNNVGLI